ncbi:ribonuclease III [Micrococcales bacterium 31B]|nr:ribonuclease III [Micrococcales bacterium 31B]
MSEQHPLCEALGIDIDPELLDLALTHRSYAYENGGLPTNERLEFLGDSVLGVVVTDALYRRFPDLPEGQLARRRAAVVNQRALAKVGRHLKLGNYLKLGKGELATKGFDKPSIVSDCVEAVIGAAYISCGMSRTFDLVIRLMTPLIDDLAMLGAGLDWKTSLQELGAAMGHVTVEYRIESSGPDHAKHFIAYAVLGDREWGSGEGGSKKEAEQHAAEQAWRAITAENRAFAVATADPSDPTKPSV